MIFQLYKTVQFAPRRITLSLRSKFQMTDHARHKAHPRKTRFCKGTIDPQKL